MLNCNLQEENRICRSSRDFFGHDSFHWRLRSFVEFIRQSTCRNRAGYDLMKCLRLAMIPLLLWSADAADLLLSPDGPIRTVQAARDAARLAPKPVRIVVAAGSYSLTEPLVLDQRDSQVIWSGKNATFTAGKKITGWEQAGDLWKAKLSDPSAKFEQLWVNGRRATLARSPNKGFYHITSAVAPNIFPDVTEDGKFQAFCVAPKQWEEIHQIPAAERDDVLITVTHAWVVGQCRVKALQRDSHAVQIKGRSRYPFVEFEPDQRFWMENYRAALDAPGEWYLDRVRGELLYHPLPDEDMNTAEVIVPVAEKFIIARGVSDLRFEGIRFHHSHDLYPAEGLHDIQAAMSTHGSIEIEDSRAVHFSRCEIAHTGQHGLWFKNGCSQCSVTHTHLHDLGGGGVYVGEMGRPDDERVNHHIVIDDCIIQHGGRRHPSACGVALTHTQKCAVTHCDIGDFYYTGVSAGWNWGYGDTASRETLVENNHIHHLGWGYLSDMGGYYGLGTSPGTIVRGNHIHHIVSHRYGGWGLYNDEGASDTTMENNLVHDTWNAGFHQHYGYFNTVRNNIFAFGKSAQIQASRNEARLRFRYTNNIVVWDSATPLLDGGEWNWSHYQKIERGDPKDSLVFRRNLYWTSDGQKPAFLGKGQISWDQWQAWGRDLDSLYADPLFENLAQRDFRLKPGSPAEKIGFKPWDLTLAGVRKEDSAWVKQAAIGHHYENWDRDAKPWPAPPYQIDETFESVALGSIGIKNVQYTSRQKGDSIGVTDEKGSPFDGGSKRSLKIQDAPDLPQHYDPVLEIHPQWDKAGTFRVRFDIMAEENADWFFEMRNQAGEFAAGPYLRWQQGRLVANHEASHALTDLKAGEWLRVEITATTSTGTYDVIITRADGQKTEFRRLPCRSSWDSAHLLLFSGLGTKQAAFLIDHFKAERVE